MKLYLILILFVVSTFSQTVFIDKMPATGWNVILIGQSGEALGDTVQGVYCDTLNQHKFTGDSSGTFKQYYDAAGGTSFVERTAWGERQILFSGGEGSAPDNEWIIESGGDITVEADSVDAHAKIIVNDSSAVMRTWTQGRIGERDNIQYVGQYAKYTTITAALAAASAGSEIRLFPGTYTEAVTITQDSISLVGSGMRNTFINGKLNFSSTKNITIQDLTVYGTDAGAQVQCGGATPTTEVNYTIRNVNIIGGGKGVSSHAFLSQSGEGMVLDNVSASMAIHGFAMRLGGVTLNNATVDSCTYGATIKSATTDSNYNDILVNNLHIKNGGGVLINADDANSLNGIVINNLAFDTCDFAVSIVTYNPTPAECGAVSNVIIGNVVGQVCTGHLISNQSGTNVLIKGVAVDTVGGYGLFVTDQGVDPVTTVSDFNIDAYGTGYSSGPYQPYETYIFQAKDFDLTQGWYTANIGILDTVTNTQYNVQVIDFNDSTKLWSGVRFNTNKIPTSSMYVEIGWFSETATTGDVVWSVKYSAVASGEDIFTGTTSAFYTATTTTDASTYDLNKTAVTSTSAFFNQNEWVFLHLARDGADVADTMAGDACLVYVKIYY